MSNSKIGKSPKILLTTMLSALTCQSCSLALYFFHIRAFYSVKFIALLSCEITGSASVLDTALPAQRRVLCGMCWGMPREVAPRHPLASLLRTQREMISLCRQTFPLAEHSLKHIPFLLKCFFLMSIWFWVEKSSGQRKREYGSTSLTTIFW